MGSILGGKPPAATQKPIVIKPKGPNSPEGREHASARARMAAASAGKNRFRVDTDPGLQTQPRASGLRIPNSGPRRNA